MSNQCRFCESRDQSLVKYGRRHYAHFHCYLDAGKTLDDLHPWQVGLFPYRLLQDRGLLAIASEIIERKFVGDAVGDRTAPAKTAAGA